MSNTTYGAIKLATAEDVGAVLKKKMGTVNGYKPKEWADTINLMGVLPIRTASGAIAHFEDGADDVPLKSLTAQILPIQEGTGDPSPTNKRPISGTSVLNVEQRGKNLLDPSSLELRVVTAGGVERASYEPIKLNAGSYTISFEGNEPMYVTNISNNYSFETITSSPYTFTIAVDSIIMIRYSGTDLNTHNDNILLEFGTTATTYEPYTGLTFTIALGRTVYGCELEVTTGVLRITQVLENLDTLNWGMNVSGQFYSAILSGFIERTANFACSCYLPSETGGYNLTNLQVSLIGSNGQIRIWIADRSFDNLQDFKDSLTGQNITLPLITPIEIQLEPTEIATLLGVNNVYLDSGDVLDLEYRADIDSLIASLEGNRGLQMTRSTPPVEEEQTEEVEENEDER